MPSPKLRDQLAKEEKKKELKGLADIRKVLSSLETKEPLHLKRLLQLQISTLTLMVLNNILNRRRSKDLEKEYKLKFDAVEQTRKAFVDDQAKLDKTLDKIREETFDL